MQGYLKCSIATCFNLKMKHIEKDTEIEIFASTAMLIID